MLEGILMLEWQGVQGSLFEGLVQAYLSTRHFEQAISKLFPYICLALNVVLI